jgi:CRP-like cAMP-binding protein
LSYEILTPIRSLYQNLNSKYYQGGFMPSPDIIDALKDAYIFQGLPNDQIEFIYGYGQKVFFNKEDIIINEKQTDHSLFIVIQGQVEVVLPKEAIGQERDRLTRIKIKKLLPGDCIGEFSLVDNEPASAAVAATGPCELFEISRVNFKNIIKYDAVMARKIYENLLKIVIKRVRQSNKELDVYYQYG